ncbi:MAG: tRNA (adenosine(37)-N6)-dimethylallyltransferase MiaA [Campylobacterales bacterium]
MKIAALIAPSASGKTELSLDIASEFNCSIFSIDSLSVYKEVDILSAKPTKKEMGDIKHYGIDMLYPNEKNSAGNVLEWFIQAEQECYKSNKNLLIVGGTLFFLKSLIQGLSPKISPTSFAKYIVEREFNSTQKAFRFLSSIDAKYANSISSNDSFRIKRGLEIYFSTNKTPSDVFAQNKKVEVAKNVEIFEIETPKEVLENRVLMRSCKMIEQGGIDEVIALERKYGRDAPYANSVGPKEVLDFLDAKLKKDELPKAIASSTMKLIKRQKTFAKTQFSKHKSANLQKCRENLEKFFKNYC